MENTNPKCKYGYNCHNAECTYTHPSPPPLPNKLDPKKPFVSGDCMVFPPFSDTRYYNPTGEEHKGYSILLCYQRMGCSGVFAFWYTSSEDIEKLTQKEHEQMIQNIKTFMEQYGGDMEFTFLNSHCKIDVLLVPIGFNYKIAHGKIPGTILAGNGDTLESQYGNWKYVTGSHPKFTYPDIPGIVFRGYIYREHDPDIVRFVFVVSKKIAKEIFV